MRKSMNTESCPARPAPAAGFATAVAAPHAEIPRNRERPGRNRRCRRAQLATWDAAECRRRVQTCTAFLVLIFAQGGVYGVGSGPPSGCGPRTCNSYHRTNRKARRPLPIAGPKRLSLAGRRRQPLHLILVDANFALLFHLLAEVEGEHFQRLLAFLRQQPFADFLLRLVQVR